MIDDEVEAFLEHHGIKGMHWGIRNDRNGVPRKTDRAAKKDAVEFARAKLFFGVGAGNRRKLIKNTVEAKKKRDPLYAKAFDRHLSEQDLSTHASKAVSERNRIDRNTRNKQRVGFIARRFTGEMGTQAALTASVLAGGAFLASPRGRSFMNNTMSRAETLINNQRLQRNVTRLINNSRP